MDSQKTNAYGVKVFHQFDGFEFQSLSSITDTDIDISYDADWGNPILMLLIFMIIFQKLSEIERL